MYSGFELNQETQSPSPDYQFNRTNDFQKGQHFYQENRHVYNVKAPAFEGGSNTFEIPHHLKMLFETENKPSFDAKPNNNFANSHTNIPSHSTIDSRKQSYAAPADHQEGLRYPSFNTLLNQSNEFVMMKNNPHDLNGSHLSGRDNKNASLANLSRDSDIRGDLNTSNSRRNMSSRNIARTKKNYQVTINEDIKLVERIEVMLNQITANHNKTCPFCNKFIDIKKSNFQNVSAFVSDTTKKYYLTHFDCYLKSNPNHSPSKVISLAGITKATINTQLTALPTIDSTNFLRSDRRAYFLSIEGFHPISSQALFKVEKICYAMEHTANKTNMLYLNLASKTSNVFEPNSYTIPYNEFRIVTTVHLSHSNEDAYTYEFIADFSQVKVTAEQKTRVAEAYYPPEGNGIVLGTQIVYDADSQLSSHLNYKIDLNSSFQSTASSSTIVKPDFGKNVFLVLKQISINLPLRRMEKANLDASPMQPLLPESLLNSQDSSMISSVEKKHHSKLHLNPHAPLFSHPTGQVDQNPPSFYMQQQGSQSGMSPYNANTGGYNSQPTFSTFMNQGNNTNSQNNYNSYFNASLFAQNFPADQPSSQYGNQFQDYNYNSMMQQQQQQKDTPLLLPPGLTLQNENNSSYDSNSQYIPRSQGTAPARNRGLKVDTKTQPYIHHVIDEASMENTPVEIQAGEDMPNLERAKSKGHNNLYAAVLSGRMADNNTGANSPVASASKIHNRYFSEINTPLSAKTPTTPVVDNYFDDEPEDGNYGEETIENFRLEDHLGGLVEFAKTYNGSRLLQKFFPRANQDEVELVIDEIEEKIDELMLDPYANYMFQTLAQSCSAEQRFRLLQEIAPSMVRIACDRKGTHSLQAIVSLVNRDMEEKLIRDSLQGHIIELAFDSQGTHLVQKLIVSISIPNLGFIYQPIVERFLEVSNHSFGLCVLKQLMTKVEKSPDLKKRLVDHIFENFENLVQNPYGNYAIQHAMDVWPNDCNILLERASEKIVQYSNQKFSSNVIEKCIVIASPEIRKKYLMEIVRSERLSELMKNKYGNYVILKLIATLDLEGKQLMIQNLVKHLNQVNVAKYRSKWAQLIEENPFKISGATTIVPQTTKPSIFKNAAENSTNTNNSEGSSPSSANWKKSMATAKEEKSQFYRESNKGAIGQRNSLSGDENESYNSPDVPKNPRRVSDGPNPEGGHRKGKNANQKFYTDKGQHHMNKGGHNSFY